MNAPLKNIENKKPSHIFDYLSIVIIISGLVLFYLLKINIWLKWGIVLFSVVSSLSLFFFVSHTGINLQSYIRDSWRELGKIVWPKRKEATQFTWIVFLFVVILALFLWLVDSSISWLLYGIILGTGS